MTPHDQLNVWWNHNLIGQLWRNALDQIGFRYETEWIKHGFPISQQLPLTQTEYAPEFKTAHQFFANLLPEAGARERLVRDLKMSNSDFELLRNIGGDCAGALSILPIDFVYEDQNSYRKLRDPEFKKIITQKKIDLSEFTGKKRPRLSLAGAQDKCPIFYDGTDFYLPENTAPSSHLLKFAVREYKNIPLYEYFLSRLASSIGLPVVETELRKSNATEYLLIRRYDRERLADGKIGRLHQEDFCQALGMGHYQKYQHEGGPSFRDCYELLSRISIQPIQDLEHLLQWQIFNVLAGNSDGHAKNISILYKKNNLAELAPFYDLVCTRAVARIDRNLAFSIGGEFTPDNLQRKHWEGFAEDCNIRMRYLETKIIEMISSIRKNLKNVRLQCESTLGPCEALQRVEQVIQKQCKKTAILFSKS